VALFWALGSTTAIFRHSGRGLRARFGKSPARGEEQRNNVGKKTAAILAGTTIAGALILCAFGLLRLSFRFFPALGLKRMEWTHVLAVIAIPEIVFIVTTVKLWRKQGPLAVGILLSAILLAMHFVIHVAANFH